MLNEKLKYQQVYKTVDIFDPSSNPESLQSVKSSHVTRKGSKKGKVGDPWEEFWGIGLRKGFAHVSFSSVLDTTSHDESDDLSR